MNNQVFRSIAKPSIIIVFLFTIAISENNNFSFKNLKDVPSYERYEFSGIKFSGKKMPIIFEYKLNYKDSSQPIWEIAGSMNLAKAEIDEKYKVRLSNLKIYELDRVQSFNGGKNISSFKYETTAPNNDDTEFIVSTIQGLIYLLRTFPFESKVDEISVRTPQQTKGKLNFNVKNKGLKTIETENYGLVQVHHLQLSLQVPFVGAIIPKLNFYFKDDKVKTLMALEGKMPIANEGEIDIQLKKYEKSL